MRYCLLIIIILLPTLSFSEIVQYRNRDGSILKPYNTETVMVRDRRGSAESQWDRNRSEYRDRSGSYEYDRPGAPRIAQLILLTSI